MLGRIEIVSDKREIKRQKSERVGRNLKRSLVSMISPIL